MDGNDLKATKKKKKNITIDNSTTTNRLPASHDIFVVFYPIA